MITWTDELAVDFPGGYQLCVDVTCKGDAVYDNGGRDYPSGWDYDADCVGFVIQVDDEVRKNFSPAEIESTVEAAIVEYLNSPKDWPWVSMDEPEEDVEDNGDDW